MDDTFYMVVLCANLLKKQARSRKLLFFEGLLLPIDVLPVRKNHKIPEKPKQVKINQKKKL